MMQTAERTDAKARYEKDGFFLATEPLIPRDLVEKAIQGMDAIRRGEYDTGRPPAPSMWNPGDDPTKLCKMEQPQFASRAVMKLVSHPALGEMAARISGARMIQAWWVQLLYKPSSAGASGTNIGFHQDRSYWKVWEEGSELFTAWVALSDVQEDCGPMRFVRGSHRWGLSDRSDFFEQNVDGQRHNFNLPGGADWVEVPAILQPGAASFHHNLTLHGSGPNQSGRPRRSFAIHLRTENARPVGGRREGLAQFIDDPDSCPVLFGRLMGS